MAADDRGDQHRRQTRRWIAAAALVGLVVRLAFGLLYWTGQPLTRDEREYLSLARSLTSGHGYVYDHEVLNGPVQPFGRAPGYPVFLALVGGGRAVVNAVPASVKIAQSIVGALGVLAVGALAWRLAGPRAARAGAAMASVYPPLVWVSAYAYSEAVFWPFGLLVVWSVDRLVLDRPRPTTHAAISGALTGAGVLLRAALTTFVPLAVLYVLWSRGLRAAVMFVLGVAIVITPWAVRNYHHHGRFVVVASDGGVTFWTGNNPLATGEGDMAANPDLKQANTALRARHPSLTEEQMEPVYYREALDWIRANPGAWIGLELKKLFYLVVPIGPSYTLHSARYFLASVVSYGAILVMGTIGFARLGSRRARTPGLWLLFISAVGVALVFFPQERFRIPVIDPTLILCASALWKNVDDGDRV